MGITTTRFIRKPLYVDAVRITGANFDEIAEWCQGEVQTDEVPGKGTKKFIKVRVHNPKNARQTKAFVGDWILYTERGYKVYTNKAFRASFDNVAELEAKQAPSETGFAKTPAVTPKTPEAVQLEAQRQAGLIGSEPIEVFTDSNDPAARVEAVEQALDGAHTPQGEPIEVVPATPEAIAEVVNEQQPVKQGIVDGPEVVAQVEEPKQPVDLTADNVEDVPAQESIEPAAAEGKRVLSIAEQKELSADEVRELVQSGEAVLAQDIAAA